VRTVPSDFESQEIKTETQAARVEREEEAEEERKKRQAEERARAEADLARKTHAARGRVRRAEGWIAQRFEQLAQGGSGGALALANLLAVVGLSGWLGYRAWGLYDRGRLGWREAGIGLGVLGAVGVVEGVFVK
jgi:hypothetical protein